MSLSVRSLRIARVGITRPAIRSGIRQRRYASTEAKFGNSGLIGGLAGGAAVAGLGYIWYSLSGVKTGVQTVSDAKHYVESLKNSLKTDKLEPGQATKWLRDTASAYAGFIPGGKSYVDAAFKQLDEVEHEHGDKVNKLISDAHGELRELAGNGGLDVATAMKAWEVMQKYLGEIGKLAEDVGRDLLEKNPEIKEQFGGKLQQLKDMGEKQGGDVKKYADETWKQVQDTIKSGKIDKDHIGKLVQDGFNKAQGFGDDAWNAAMEKAKPFLDKQPEVKKMIEENADKLKQSDFGSIVKQLQNAAQTKDATPLKEFVEKQMQSIEGMTDQAWKGALAQASVYLEKFPEIQEFIEGKADVLRKINFDELMDQIRKAKDTGDFSQVKSFVEKKAKELQNK